MRIPAPVWLAPLLAGLFFLSAGLALIPWPGLQNDELFFSGPIYYPDGAFYRIEAGAMKIPFMVMSYSGALKTWLYAALFEFFVPNEWSVRVPVLLMGVGTIWLTWIWIRRIAGNRTAAIATSLLATDAIFLLTNTFDWGPVAIQHLLLMGGLVAIQTWIAKGSIRMLALGFFLWGLGMWDKALLIWPLLGLLAGCLAVYPRELLRRLRPMPAGIALASFILGALPLIWYNIDRPGETATTNAKFTAADLSGKVSVLRQTIDGSALFGYMVYRDPAPNNPAPRKRIARLSAAISRLLGPRRTNWMLPAWILAFLCFTVLWRSPAWRPLLFLLIATSVAWAQMAATSNAGGSAHHTILLWPFPVAFIGIAFSGMADRFPRFGPAAVTLATGILVLGNILNTNEYLAEFALNGAAGGWTDAIYPLANSVEHDSANGIGLVDWGYLNGLRLLHEGDLPLFIASPDGPSAEIKRMVGSPDFLFIEHTDDKQLFPGINDRLRKAAGDLGYVEHVERTVEDRTGRPVFELFRFRKSP